jgi:predicted ATPase
LVARDVQWCDLASLTDPHSVASSVCAACGFRQQAGRSATESLAAGIATRRLLLVFDNCEHVLDAVRALSATILAECPNMHLLATSRQPLDLAGEIVVRVGPLAAVDSDGRPGPAAQLFVVRAGERGSHLASDDATMNAVVEVCNRLDGLPLAVELAAARTTVLTPAEIGIRLDRSFEILRLPHPPLGGLPRHQTLMAAIAWSYDLLDLPERALFERLSVFAGSFGLDAAESICALPTNDPEPILEVLDALVDRSLVVAEDSVIGKRYRMLDTIQRFAATRLAQRGDTAQLRVRRDNWYRAFAADIAGGARTDQLVAWQRRFDADLPNLRATFEDLLSAGDADGCQVLVAHLWPAVVGSSSFIPTDWAPAALALAPEHVGPATAAARAVAAWGAVIKGDYDLAQSLAEKAIEAVTAGSDDDGSAANVVGVQSMFTRKRREQAAVVAGNEVRAARRASDPERLIRALAYRYFSRSSHDSDQRRRDALEAVEQARALGHPGNLGMTLCHLAWQHHRDGNDDADALATEAATMSSLARDDTMYAYAMHLLGAIAHEHGRLDEALEHVAKALHCWRRSGDARVWVALHQIAELLADAGDLDNAVVLAAGVGTRNLGAQVHLRPETLAAAEAAIEPDRRNRLSTAGAARDQDELIAVAIAAIRQQSHK